MKRDDILVGDLINIMVGDIMPIDIILIEVNGIKMDESCLTGERDSLRKKLYEKFLIMKNKNRGLIYPPLHTQWNQLCGGDRGWDCFMVGDHSQKGIIRRTVDNDQETSQTPLEKKLEDIAEKIGIFGMVSGIITLVALTIRFIINYLKNDKQYKKDYTSKDILMSYLINYQNDINNVDIKN